MRELDITALMCSKICHDLISPVGALANGLEVLAEEQDAEMREHAMTLLDVSVRTASAKLQFARLAFGAGGSASDIIELPYAEKVARGLFENGKATLDWRLPSAVLPKNTVRLLLNLLVLANDAIPRGGNIVIEGVTPGNDEIRVTATGSHARVPEGMQYIKDTPDSTDGLDARAIQPYVTALLAREIGAEVSAELVGEDVVFTLRLPAAALAA